MHPSLEPTRNQPTEYYALNGRNPTSDSSDEHTIAPISRAQSSTSENGAHSSGNVDDKNPAISLHPITRPYLAPPTCGPPPASTALERPLAPLALAPPSAIHSISLTQAPVSSRLRTRPEKSQRWRDSMGIGPKQEKEQSKKRKASKEMKEPAKRAKTEAKNIIKTTTKRLKLRSAVARSSKTKQQDPNSKATIPVEFPNLIIPSRASSSVATPISSKEASNSISQNNEPPQAVSGSSKSGPAPEVAAKEAPLKAAASKERACVENGEDEEDGHTSPVKRRRLAMAPRAQNPRKIINHALIDKLEVFVCGQGYSGELGLGNGKTAIDVKHPRLNHNLLPNKVGVVHIAVGGKHAAALTYDGLVYTWGSNGHGALGRDTTTRWQSSANNDMEIHYEDDIFDLNTLESTPMPIPREKFPLDIVFTKMACGDSTTFALTDDGDVWGWGTFRTTNGILAFSKDVKIQSTPTKLPNLSKVKQLACGANHVIALREDGKVFIWGFGEQNQLGHRVSERKLRDYLVPTPLYLNKKFRLIGCGIDHSFAVEINREDVWAWGLNSYGQTGFRDADGSFKDAIISPVRVPTLSLSGDTISTITGGSYHSAAITTKGKLLVWGRADSHQLGMNSSSLSDLRLIKDSSDRLRILARPTELQLTTAIGTAIFVAAGYDHSIALNTAGKAYSWGLNVHHQCGNGTKSTDIDEPTCIDNPALRNRELNWAGCGRKFSVMAGVAKFDGGGAV